MRTCACEPPARLHLRPTGVHLPDGSSSNLEVVDEVWEIGSPSCSVCDVAITDTFYRCVPCNAIVCRACLAHDTTVVECDCAGAFRITGVELAARRVAAAHAG
ncbi:MAG TPA: hypothetical protein VG520_09690 [Candidatus Dormibacteraeota bacterium]|jgi:hypothetical protein|nr:hypothetical protein [Candidatus Dormibacteraeota bacterium]